MNLIDREALLDFIRDRIGVRTEEADYHKSLFIEVVKRQPTIEAVPVVHGEWIYENYTWHCGVCGFHPFKGYIPKEPGFNFCPNCGAMMKGGVE